MAWISTHLPTHQARSLCVQVRDSTTTAARGLEQRLFYRALTEIDVLELVDAPVKERSAPSPTMTFEGLRSR